MSDTFLLFPLCVICRDSRDSFELKCLLIVGRVVELQIVLKFSLIVNNKGRIDFIMLILPPNMVL